MRLLFMTSPAPKRAGFSTAEKKPPLGTGILLSILKKRGHEVIFSDEYLKPSGILDGDFLEKERIDATGIYSNTVCFSETLEILYKLQTKREKGSWRGVILLGGPHSSVALQTIPEFVDHIVLGEGEISVPKILEENCTDRIVIGEKVTDMDSIPKPAWEEFIYRGYEWTSPWSDVFPVYTMNTSRGCPFQCSFCSVQAVWGKTYRFMSAQRVVEDIEHLVRHYGAKGIFFREDHFTLNKQRTMEICELLLKRNINIEWYCETRVDQLDDPEYQALMARAGCKAFYIGVESGSPRMLKIFKKGETVEQFIRAFEIAHSVGIKTYASLVVGTPFETGEDVLLTERLIERIRPYRVGRNVYVGLPGSEIYERLLRDGDYEHMDAAGVLYPNKYLDNVDRYYGGLEYFKPYSLTQQHELNYGSADRFSEIDPLPLHKSKVVVFGSGSLATSIYRFLKEQQIFPIGVFDNDPKREGTLFEGVRVVRPSFIEGAKVIVASMWEQEIVLQLKSLGYGMEDILSMGPDGRKK
jgi:O-antigen biosynthesis protein